MFVVLPTQFKLNVAELRGFVPVLFEMSNKASVRNVVTTSFQADHDESSDLLDLVKYLNAESIKSLWKQKSKMATTLSLLSSSLLEMENWIL